MENLFWDKKMSPEEIKNILKDESNKEFISLAALLLGRTTDIKGVFSTYLDKITFCNNWRKIKQKMREEKWKSPNINFWDEVYKFVVEKNKDKIQLVQRREELKRPELGNLSDIIKKTRKEYKWTQKELAENVGLSQQTISLMESGKFNFSVKSLMKILSALKLRFELKPRDEYQNSMDSVQAELRPFEHTKSIPFEYTTSEDRKKSA